MQHTSSTPRRTFAGMQHIHLMLSLLIMLLAMICAGFLFTMIARSGLWLLLSFGLLGVIVFVQNFPWLAVVLFVLLDTGIVMMLRRSSSWKYRSLYLLIGLSVVATLGGGFLLSTTSLYAWWQPPPPRHDPLSRGYGAWRFHNLFSGTIAEIRESDYVILGPDGQTFTIDVTPGTEFPEGRDFAVGDGILVIGESRKDSIRAFGIRPFTPPAYPPNRMR